ncbi:SDR family NAD(P)-dependent oxidoreductase, partial [Thermodesulfobacteriota bacterium]
MSGSRKVLVTGIGGFVGSHLARELLENGYRIEGTVFTDADVENAKKLTADEDFEIREEDIHHCDIRDSEAVEALIGRSAPDCLVHLAAVTFVPASMENPKDTFETNLFGTMNLLNAMKSRGPDASVLYVSSSEVYGLVAEEDMPMAE